MPTTRRRASSVVAAARDPHYCRLQDYALPIGARLCGWSRSSSPSTVDVALCIKMRRVVYSQRHQLATADRTAASMWRRVARRVSSPPTAGSSLERAIARYRPPHRRRRASRPTRPRRRRRRWSVRRLAFTQRSRHLLPHKPRPSRAAAIAAACRCRRQAGRSLARWLRWMAATQCRPLNRDLTPLRSSYAAWALIMRAVARHTC